MKQLLALSLLVIWVFPGVGYCNDNVVMDKSPANRQDEVSVKFYSSGIFMYNGDRYLVIDDHVFRKSSEFNWIDKPESGDRIWFRQNRSGEVVDAFRNR